METRVLLIDDAPEIRESVRASLERSGYQVEGVGSGQEGLSRADALDPDVILLDLALPDLDGVEVCRRLRTKTNAYIIMLTAKSEEVDKLIGLSVGADDYITKPFSARELEARIQAVLRRPRANSDRGKRVTVNGLTLDAESREVLVDGREVNLTRVEFDILAALTSRPRMIFSRRQLIDRVWGPDWYGDGHLIDVHIAELRRKVGDDPRDPRYIRTVRGVGYGIALT